MPISTSPACPPSVRGLEELAWLVPGQAQPDNLAPLLRDHVLPALARRARKTRKPRPNTGRAPIMR